MVGGLKLENLTKTFPDFQILASFEVASNERAVLVGRSGVGKTTLFRMIAGLDPLDPGGGKIYLNQKNLEGIAPEKRKIGVVFQEPHLFTSMDLIDNATFGLMMRGMRRKEREALVFPWLEKVELQGCCTTPVDRLSGGERQRLSLVRAWVWKPELLLLDEPFSALDLSLRDRLRMQVLDLHTLWPVPLLLVTHDEADAKALGTVRIEVQEKPGSITRNFVRLSPLQR